MNQQSVNEPDIIFGDFSESSKDIFRTARHNKTQPENVSTPNSGLNSKSKLSGLNSKSELNTTTQSNHVSISTKQSTDKDTRRSSTEKRKSNQENYPPRFSFYTYSYTKPQEIEAETLKKFRKQD